MQKPILVGLNPTEKDKRATKRLFQIAQVWSQPRQKIIPVTVISPIDVGWPVHALADVKDQLFKGIRTRMEKLLKSTGVKSQATEIIYSRELSMTEAARMLAKEASQQKAEMIAVHAHAGAKPHFFGIGSFTERVIGLSTVPVLVMGHRARAPKKISRIVFPTDFSEESQKTFAKVLELGKRFGAEVILLHRYDPPIYPIGVNAYGIAFDPLWMEEYINSSRYQQQTQGEEWEAKAKKNGVNCRFLLDESFGSLSAQIAKAVAKEKADILAIHVHRGEKMQMFLGREVRALFSKAHCPVLVMRS